MTSGKLYNLTIENIFLDVLENGSYFKGVHRIGGEYYSNESRLSTYENNDSIFIYNIGYTAKTKHMQFIDHQLFMFIEKHLNVKNLYEDKCIIFKAPHEYRKLNGEFSCGHISLEFIFSLYIYFCERQKIARFCNTLDIFIYHLKNIYLFDSRNPLNIKSKKLKNNKIITWTDRVQVMMNNKHALSDALGHSVLKYYCDNWELPSVV